MEKMKFKLYPTNEEVEIIVSPFDIYEMGKGNYIQYIDYTTSERYIYDKELDIYMKYTKELWDYIQEIDEFTQKVFIYPTNEIVTIEKYPNGEFLGYKIYNDFTTKKYIYDEKIKRYVELTEKIRKKIIDRKEIIKTRKNNN